MSLAFIPPPKLERITPAALAEVQDDVIESALVEYVLDHSRPSERMVDAVAHFPEALRSWYIAYTIDAELMNGGFNQFFFNVFSEFTKEAPAAFARVGIPDAGAIVERAAALLPSYAPVLDRARARGTIDAFMDTYSTHPFSEVDKLYASNESRWRDARIRFIRENAEALQHP
jgi:hypothetical protein